MQSPNPPRLFTAQAEPRQVSDTATDHRHILFLMARQLLSEGRLGWLRRRELERFAKCLEIDAFEAGLIIRAAQENTVIQLPAADEAMAQQVEAVVPTHLHGGQSRITLVVFALCTVCVGLALLRWLFAAGR